LSSLRAPGLIALRGRLVLVLLILAATGSGGYLLWNRRPLPPEPPAVNMDGADPAVVAAVKQAAARVRQAPRSAGAWGELGLVLLSHDFRAEAVSCFTEAERLDDREPRWPYLCGVTLALGEPKAALPQLHRAVELVGETEDAPRLRLAETLLGQGETEEAAQHFRRILERHPETANPFADYAQLGLARVAFDSGDEAGGWERLEHCVVRPFTRKAAHALLAEVRERQGDAAAAAREMAQAEDLPTDVPWPDPFLDEVEKRRVGKQGLFAQADRLLDQGQVEEAGALLEQGVLEYPDAAEAWLLLGRVQLRRQNTASAESALRTAQQLAPDLVDTQFYMGVVLALRQDNRAAAACFRTATELKPDYALAQYNLGRCLLQEGDEPRASAAFRAAVRCKPHYAQAHAALGELLARAGRKDEAVEHLRHALALDPADPGPRQLLEQLEASDSAPKPP
jgi:tetratricopeptide (TPR) repeat protein